MNRTAALLFFTLVGGSCFDPLYEDGGPLTAGWVLCCPSGTVNTCFCDEATSCQQRLFACPGGMCSATPQCVMGGTGGGAAGGAGGGGGFADAGTVSDGGAGGGSGGGAGGGGGGGGGGASQAFEFCCVGARVSTCACPATGCANQPFTPCSGGGCTTSAVCP